MASKVVVNLKPLRELVDRVKTLAGSGVEVGWFGGEIALIALWMEFGTKTIPERPALRATFSMRADEIADFQRRLMRLFVAGKIDKSTAFDMLGEYAVSLVRETVIKYGPFIFQPLKPATIRAKGGKTSPLIDSGQLINSVSYRIVG